MPEKKFGCPHPRKTAKIQNKNVWNEHLKETKMRFDTKCKCSFQGSLECNSWSRSSAKMVKKIPVPECIKFHRNGNSLFWMKGFSWVSGRIKQPSLSVLMSIFQQKKLQRHPLLFREKLPVIQEEEEEEEEENEEGIWSIIIINRRRRRRRKQWGYMINNNNKKKKKKKTKKKTKKLYNQ